MPNCNIPNTFGGLGEITAKNLIKTCLGVGITNLTKFYKMICIESLRLNKRKLCTKCTFLRQLR